MGIVLRIILLINLICLVLVLPYYDVISVIKYAAIFFGVVIYIFNFGLNIKIEKAIKLVVFLALVLAVLEIIMGYWSLMNPVFDLPSSPSNSQLAQYESNIIVTSILSVLPVMLGCYYIFNVKSMFQIKRD